MLRVFSSLFKAASGAWAHDFAALPSQCAVCRRVNAQRVCSDCLEAFCTSRLRCSTCALPLPESAAPDSGKSRLRCGACLSLGSALDACHAAVDYAYPWHSLVQRLKYADAGSLSAEPAMAHSLAEVMQYAAAQDASLRHALQAAERCDGLIAIPLHPSRLQERGFNQAQALTQALFPRHPRIRSHWLLRIKATLPQAELPPDERSANLRAAFAVEPRRAHELRGARVCLIDDVSTTGATLQAAAAALHTAGAREIQAIIFARTTPS